MPQHNRILTAMAVLLPLSSPPPHPTLSPFRFRGFINIASLQGRSVHPLDIPICLCFSFLFFPPEINSILNIINKWSTLCNWASLHLSVSLIRDLLTRSLWSRQAHMSLIYRGSQAVCRNSFAFQTSLLLWSSVELSYHRNSRDERGTFSTTVPHRDSDKRTYRSFGCLYVCNS